ncbi:hypothetical protein HanHA300_Chr10g0382701 [Helianthus annuus]|nr:hypothetical protein HanHA300_Chr10g0382701 [Helianthus annuus]KAJ0531821.1 hypothetical protein HanHA89_Chr10g0405161 [Helianthus annuus]
MEPDPDSSPALWFQPPVTTTRRRRTPLIDPVFLIILIPVLALLFFFICIPPFLSHASHNLNPKSTWDSLNMFLVLFAILCGLMSRKDDDDVTLTSSSASFVAEGSDHSSVGFSDRKVVPYGYFEVESLRESESLNQNEEDEVVNSDVKEIHVDTSNAAEQPHSFRSVGKDVKFNVPTNIESDYLNNKVMISSYPTPPPPPPPPPMKHKHKTLERKVSDATKEIATVISSLYNHRKKKSKRPPPPPPPPPPPSVFRNPFKKGGKRNKRIYSVPATVPPPPPPPSSIFNNIFKSGNKSKRFLLPSPAPPSSIMNSLIKTGTKSKRFNASSPPPLPPPRYTMSTGKPPLPTKTSSCYESGSQSAMPPPPPPFKVSDMKFEVRGDFVKIRSAHSCVCGSPDHDIDDVVGGDLIGPGNGLICFPSPDVDAKADSFISRLKDEWKKEKIYYVNEKLG